MKELSVFLDESGDFGELKDKPAYYLVSMVFHDQQYNIDDEIVRLEHSLAQSGTEIEYIHTGPVIRREDIFKNLSLDNRRKLIYKLLNFYNKCNIKHHTIIVNRKETPDKISLSGRLAKEISNVIKTYSDFFYQFDKVIVYYDNGQTELSSLLNAAFSILLSNVEFRKAEPQKYRLLQIADFICTLELMKIKQDEKRLSRSEQMFFYKTQELKKTFFKSIDKKRL